MRVLFLYGTRPEAIKMAPLLQELGRDPASFAVRCVVTAQHRGLLDQVHEAFGIRPDVDLDLMTEGQTLESVTARAIERLVPLLQAERPDVVLVQGDTTTTMVSTLAAFYCQIPVGHVEAGLRTHDRYSPFPEEGNRRVTTALATLHFAPTETTRTHLLAAGVPESDVYLTGNTVIDAVLAVARGPAVSLPELDDLDPARPLVVLTMHRRESFGGPLTQICQAVRELARRRPGVDFVFPVHPNPNVRSVVFRDLSGLPNLRLTEPIAYFPFVHLMKRARILLTDSGGLQEEGPALRKPVLVLRESTERPEAVVAGTARLVGSHPQTIIQWVERLLDDPDAYRLMADAPNPYGDGTASVRIAGILRNRISGRPA